MYTVPVVGNLIEQIITAGRKNGTAVRLSPFLSQGGYCLAQNNTRSILFVTCIGTEDTLKLLALMLFEEPGAVRLI